ncbi:MAG TPA: hypothetical protein VK473_03435, partial [Terriglobales bacterium]|nr:hypothetical protein [Terriglobales bacterium]
RPRWKVSSEGWIGQNEAISSSVSFEKMISTWACDEGDLRPHSVQDQQEQYPLHLLFCYT